MTRKKRWGRSPKYMRLAIRHTRWSAGWPGDAIGRVPLYTKEAPCQVIAPVRFEVCLALKCSRCQGTGVLQKRARFDGLAWTQGSRFHLSPSFCGEALPVDCNQRWSGGIQFCRLIERGVMAVVPEVVIAPL